MSKVAVTKGTHYVAYDDTETAHEHEVTGWVGWVAFGGFLMILAGMFQAIAGLVALFQQSFYTVAPNQIILIHNIHTWGWVNLIIGAVVFLAGFALFTGATWARVLGVLFAMSYAVANLVAISLYPVWSIIGITLAVLVMYALIVHGGELKEPV